MVLAVALAGRSISEVPIRQTLRWGVLFIFTGTGMVVLGACSRLYVEAVLPELASMLDSGGVKTAMIVLGVIPVLLCAVIGIVQKLSKGSTGG